MAYCPIYNVVLIKTGQDITDHVTGLHYEDCVDEDDEVKIQLGNLTSDWIDKAEINKGAEISFMFGFQGKCLSGKRIAIIKDFETDYSETITGTITALDYGFLFKKATSNRVFKDKTTSEIIEEIATLFGMPCEMERTTTVHATEPMGNMTYWKFMQKLVNKAGSTDSKKGAFQLFVRDGTLCFQQKDLSKKPKRMFVYGDGSGEVVSFKPKYEQKDSDSSGVTVAGIDPKTNTPYKEKAEPGTETATGENQVHYDVNKTKVSYSGNVTPHSSRRISLPEDDDGRIKQPSGTTADHAKSQAKGSLSKATDKELTATLQTLGDIDVASGDIITVNGVAKKHGGNWYVMKVIYDVAESGFDRELELNKTGSKKKATETDSKNKLVNKQSGLVDPEYEKKVTNAVYDENGKLIPNGEKISKPSQHGGGSSF